MWFGVFKRVLLVDTYQSYHNFKRRACLTAWSQEHFSHGLTIGSHIGRSILKTQDLQY